MKRMDEDITTSQKTRGIGSLCQLVDLFSLDYLIPGFSDSRSVQEVTAISISELFQF